jgi:hypothetical protein
MRSRRSPAQLNLFAAIDRGSGRGVTLAGRSYNGRRPLFLLLSNAARLRPFLRRRRRARNR